jgi:hypothetical protein
MIASRARSDPIPLPLGSIPGPASVHLFESMNQRVLSTGGVSIVSTVWAPLGGGYSRYGAGSSSYGPVGLKSGSIKGSPISAPCREIKRHRPKSSLGCC